MHQSTGIENTTTWTSVPAAEVFTAPFAVKVWLGASGRWYVHAVYRFVGCPALTSAVYIFVRQEPAGQRAILGVGYTESDVASLNLAALRQRGALLGATEVHVHEVDGPVNVLAQTAFDLSEALMPRDARLSSGS